MWDPNEPSWRPPKGGQLEDRLCAYQATAIFSRVGGSLCQETFFLILYFSRQLSITSLTGQERLAIKRTAGGKF
jgi:hypothetical protein